MDCIVDVFVRRIDNHSDNLFICPRYYISWSDIQLFLRCPRCFYISKKMRIKAVSDFDDHCCSLSNFTDQLLKKEFDHFRKYCVSHPIMEQDGVNIKHPFKTRKIDEWRTAWNFITQTPRGIQFHDLDKNVIV